MTSRIKFDPEANNQGTGRVVDRRNAPPPPAWTGQPVDRIMDAVGDIGGDIADFVTREPFDNPFPGGSGLNPFGEEDIQPGHPRGGRPTGGRPTSYTLAESEAARAAVREQDQYMTAGEIARRAESGEAPLGIQGAARAVDFFADAIKRAESRNPRGDYGQVKGTVRGGNRILGAYGIPEDEWATLAAEAGLSGARWRDPRAQDWVARHAFRVLNDKYGDWRWVAMAWKAGERGTDNAYRDPRVIEMPQLRGLRNYVESVMTHAREAITTSQDPTRGNVVKEVFKSQWDDLFEDRVSIGNTMDPENVPWQATDDVEAILRRQLYAMRNRVFAHPEEPEDGGEPFTPDQFPDVTAGDADNRTQAPNRDIRQVAAQNEREAQALVRVKRDRGLFRNRTKAGGSGGVQEA